MELKGVVGASERNPWHKRNDTLAPMEWVICHFESGVTEKSYKGYDGAFLFEECFGPVLYWMRIPPLPKE